MNNRKFTFISKMKTMS